MNQNRNKSQIRIFPDAVLRKKTEIVTVFDANLRDLVKTMAQIMKSQPYGVGIAAPQIGVSKAVAIVDVTAREPKSSQIVLVNPVILERREPEVRKEGCMSLPDYSAFVKRHKWIRFKWQDAYGESHEKVSEGIEAVCVEHEADHLNGILFIDHVTCLKTDMLPRKPQHKMKKTTK